MNKTQRIGKVRCEDCGPSIISRPDQISIFFDGDDYNAITLCSFCNRQIYLPVSKDVVDKFAENGVRVFSWLTGEQIVTKDKV